MVIGLGEGLEFIIWQIKNITVPFIGGGVREGQKVRILVANLGLKVIEF